MEGVLLRVLDTTLGKYVHGLNKENLKVGVWSGNVDLVDVEVRQDALASAFQLPVHVRKGKVRRIALTVPWNKLSSSPVVVRIEGLHVVAVPTDTSRWTDDDHANFAWALKQKLISRLDAERNRELLNEMHSEGEGKLGGKGGAGWVETLVKRVVSNLQVTITDVHVRYEHTPCPLPPAPSPPTPRSCFAAGLTVRELSVLSTDESWLPHFEHNLTLSRKLVRLEGLSVYADHDSAPVPTATHAAFGAAMACGRGVKQPDHCFVLHPTTARMKLKLVVDASLNDKALARTEAELELERVHTAVSDAQYHTALEVVAHMSRFGRRSRFHNEQHRLRTQLTAHRGNASARARARWLYAIACVRKAVAKSSWDWREVTYCVSVRKRYVDLFVGLCQSNAEEVLEEVHALERQLPVPAIVTFRALARVRVLKQRMIASKQAAKQPKKTRGLFWRRRGPDPSDGLAVGADELQLTDEEVQALESLARDLTEGAVTQPAVGASNMAVVLVRAKLRAISLSLRNSDGELCQVSMERSRVCGRVGAQGLNLVAMALGDLVVVDRVGSDARLSLGTDPQGGLILAQFSTGDAQRCKVDGIGDDAFFDKTSVRVVWERLSFGSDNDAPLQSVKLESAPLVMLCPQPRTLHALLAMLDSSQVAEVDAVIGAASEMYEGAKDEATRRFASSLKTAPRTSLDLHVQAPRVIVPARPHGDQRVCACVDMGTLSLVLSPEAPQPAQDWLVDSLSFHLTKLRIGLGEVATVQDKSTLLLQPFSIAGKATRCAGPGAPDNRAEWSVAMELGTAGNELALLISKSQANTLLSVAGFVQSLAPPEAAGPRRPRKAPSLPFRTSPNAAPAPAPAQDPHGEQGAPEHVGPDDGARKRFEGALTLPSANFALLDDAGNELFSALLSSFETKAEMAANGDTQASLCLRAFNVFGTENVGGTKLSIVRSLGGEGHNEDDHLAVVQLTTHGRESFDANVHMQGLEFRWFPEFVVSLLRDGADLDWAQLRRGDADHPNAPNNRKSNDPGRRPLPKGHVTVSVVRVAVSMFEPESNSDGPGSTLLAEFSAVDLALQATMQTDGALSARASLGNLVLHESDRSGLGVPRNAPSLQTHILGCQNPNAERMLVVEYNTFSPRSPSFPGYGRSVHVTVQQITVVYVKCVVDAVRDYLTHGVLGVLVKRAATAAAEISVELFHQKTQAQAEKDWMKVEVAVRSPEILVPVSHGAAHGVLVYPGHIQVSNSLQLVEEGIYGETFRVSLTNASVLLSPDEATTELVRAGKADLTPLRLTQDIEIAVTMTMQQWSREMDNHFPLSRVNVNIPNLKLRLTPAKLSLLLGVVSDNLTSPEVILTYTSAAEAQHLLRGSVKPRVVMVQANPTNLFATASLPELSVEFARDEGFVLPFLSATMSSFQAHYDSVVANGSQLTVVLGSLEAIDHDPLSVFPRVWYRGEFVNPALNDDEEVVEPQEASECVRLVYVQAPDGNKRVELDITSQTFVLSPSYLFALVDFVQGDEGNQKGSRLSRRSLETPTPALPPPTPHQQQPPPAESDGDSDSAPSPSTHIQVKLSNTNVVVLEDACDPKCEVAVFGMQLEATRQLQARGSASTHVTISELRVFTCDLADPEMEPYHVLRPSALLIHWTQSQRRVGDAQRTVQHSIAQVSFTPTELILSLSLAQFLTRLSRSWEPPGRASRWSVGTDGDVVVEDEGDSDDEAEAELDAEAEMAHDLPLNAHRLGSALVLAVDVKAVTIVVLDDSRACPTPLLELMLVDTVSYVHKNAMGEGELVASAFAKLKGAFFNPDRGVWEPLFPLWELKFQGSSEADKTNACIESHGVLQFTLTRHFLMHCQDAADRWLKALSPKEAEEQDVGESPFVKRSAFSLYWVHNNQTGHTLHVRTLGYGYSTPREIAVPSSTVPQRLSLGQHQAEAEWMQNITSAAAASRFMPPLSLGLGKGWSELPVDFSTPGEDVLLEFRKDGKGFFADCGVRVRNGERHLVVSSASSVVNSTSLPLLVRVGEGEGAITSELAPQSTFPLPLVEGVAEGPLVVKAKLGNVWSGWSAAFSPGSQRHVLQCAMPNGALAVNFSVRRSVKHAEMAKFFAGQLATVTITPTARVENATAVGLDMLVFQLADGFAPYLGEVVAMNVFGRHDMKAMHRVSVEPGKQHDVFLPLSKYYGLCVKPKNTDVAWPSLMFTALPAVPPKGAYDFRMHIAMGRDTNNAHVAVTAPEANAPHVPLFSVFEDYWMVNFSQSPLAFRIFCKSRINRKLAQWQGLSGAGKVIQATNRVGQNQGATAVTEMYYENQRRAPFHNYSRGGLTPLDFRGEYSDLSDEPYDLSRRNTLPSREWRWDGGWEVRKERGRTDREGWEYAVNWSSTWYNESGAFCFVRRRLWQRRRVRVEDSESESDGGSDADASSQFTKLSMADFSDSGLKMLSVGHHQIKKARIAVRAADSDYSHYFNPNATGLAMKVAMQGQSQFYELTVRVRQAPAPFQRTKVVTLAPKLFLFNRTDQPILYRQAGTNAEFTIPARGSHPAHCLAPNSACRLQVRLNHSLPWCLPFAVGVGTFELRLGKARNGPVLQVDVHDQQGQIVVVFQEDVGTPRYRVVNLTPLDVHVAQDVPGAEAWWDNVPPGTQLRYALPSVLHPPNVRVTVEEVPQQNRAMSPPATGAVHSMSLAKRGDTFVRFRDQHLRFRVVQNGGTATTRIKLVGGRRRADAPNRRTLRLKVNERGGSFRVQVRSMRGEKSRASNDFRFPPSSRRVRWSVVGMPPHHDPRRLRFAIMEQRGFKSQCCMDNITHGRVTPTFPNSQQLYIGRLKYDGELAVATNHVEVFRALNVDHLVLQAQPVDEQDEGDGAAEDEGGEDSVRTNAVELDLRGIEVVLDYGDRLLGKASLIEIQVSLDVSGGVTSLRSQVGTFQLSNFLEEAAFPLALSPRDGGAHAWHMKQPVLQLQLVHRASNTPIALFETVSVAVQPLAANVEFALIRALSAFFDLPKQGDDKDRDVVSPLLNDDAAMVWAAGYRLDVRRAFVERLVISPIDLVVSSSGVELEGGGQLGQAASAALHVISKVHHLSIHAEPVVLEEELLTAHKLLEKLRACYWERLMNLPQVLSVVVSLDLLSPFGAT